MKNLPRSQEMMDPGSELVTALSGIVELDEKYVGGKPRYEKCVGYNESSNHNRSGSHNIVVGLYHDYSSFGGLVTGNGNSI
jgi:hypothetical protein